MMKNLSLASSLGGDLGVAVGFSEDTITGVVGERISLIVSAAMVVSPTSGWALVEAGDGAVLSPRRRRHKSLTPLKFELWNLVMAAAHVSALP